MVAKLTIGVLVVAGIVFISTSLRKTENNSLASKPTQLTATTLQLANQTISESKSQTTSEENNARSATLKTQTTLKPSEEATTTTRTSSDPKQSPTSKSEPKSTTQATSSPTTVNIEIVNLPYNPHCEDTPDAGDDDSFIKALFWNCYIRSYDLGQVSNFEFTDFKNIVATQGRDYLMYDVIMESAEFACLIGDGSCDAIDLTPPIAPNKQGRCGTVHEYDPDEGAGASLRRIDHACNK